MIITPTSLTITQLFGSTNEQYVIPTYQRRYSWHERQVWELIDDILLIDEGDTHLLGSIVCLAGHHTAGLNRLELVDGQQRMTTVTIILECIRQRLERDGEADEARYCLERIEAARHGAHEELQVLGAADVHVEHIIPQKIKTKKAKEEFGDWVTYLGDKAESQHPKYVARIGNLTLFAGALNISASNNPFGMKKQAYKDSGILLTKELASMQHFKFKNVDQRSSVLAAQAVELWPIP